MSEKKKKKQVTQGSGAKTPKGGKQRSDSKKKVNISRKQSPKMNESKKTDEIDLDGIEKELNAMPDAMDIFRTHSKTTPPQNNVSIYDDSQTGKMALLGAPNSKLGKGQVGIIDPNSNQEGNNDNQKKAINIWGALTQTMKASVLEYEAQGKNKKLVGLQKIQDPEFNRSNAMFKSQKFGQNYTHGSSMMQQSMMGVSQQPNNIKTLGMTSPNMDGDPCEEHEDLRTAFIKSYGIKMEIPAYYHYDAKFVPHYPDHVVTMGFHIVSKSVSTVQTTYFDKRVEECFLKDIQSSTGANNTHQLPSNIESQGNQENDIDQEKGIMISLNIAKGRNGFLKKRSVILAKTKKCLMNFSKSGLKFSIYNQKQGTLKVFDSSNIDTCFDLIENDQPMFRAQIEYPDFNAKILEIDMQDKYVMVTSKERVLIFLIEKTTEGHPVHQYGDYTIDSDKYEQIMDAHMDSGFDKKNFYKEVWGKEMPQNLSVGLMAPFTCMVACKPQGITAVHIFDINENDESQIRNISYRKEEGYLRVDISENFFTAVMSNQSEFYVLKGQYQTNFTGGFKNKFLRYVFNDKDAQYAIASKSYDRDFDILQINDPQFHASIVRSLEPGMYEIQDVQINAKTNQMQTLIRINDTVYLDTIDLKLGYEGKPKQTVIASCEEKMYHSYSFNWPYFAMATKDNFIFIFNAFNQTFIQRYELPSYVTVICDTFLTDTHDFFCIVETKKEEFEILQIDLDSDTPFIQGPIFKYPFKQVKDKQGHAKQVSEFHVRGSSHKEKINLNKKMIVIVKHEDELWAWNEGIENDKMVKIEMTKLSGKIEDAIGSNDVVKEPITISNLYYESDDNVFYMTTYAKKIDDTLSILHSKIMIIECKFGSFSVRKVYQEKDQKAEILNFGVDNTRRRLMVLSGIKNTKDKRDKFFTIYDIETETTIVRLQIFNTEIIGRLKTNLYNFVEGHIYFNNKVVKVRYDLLEQQNGGEIKENQLFDHYDDIINLRNKNNKVEMGMPLQTCLYNRLAYVVKNFKETQPRFLMILPYLHERKIYLNKRHDNSQFYTIQKWNGQNYILCMALNDNKMYVYDEVGILRDKIIYKDIYDKCGRPERVSESGEYLLFSKSQTSTKNHLVKLNVDSLEVTLTVDLKVRMENQVRKLTGMKQLLANELMDRVKSRIQKKNTLKNFKDIGGKAAQLGKDNIKNQFAINDGTSDSSESEEKEPPKVQQIDAKDVIEFWKVYLVELKDLKKVSIDFNLNDHGDVLARVKPKKIHLNQVNQRKRDEFLNNEDENYFEKSCFYFFYPNEEGDNADLEDYLFFDDEVSHKKYHKDSETTPITNVQGASMNTENIFFWNLGNAWSLNLKSRNLKRLGLYISEKDPNTFIRLVRCFTCPKGSMQKVAVRVAQSPQKDVLIFWDLEKDLEIESYDLEADAIPFQDSHGNSYIVDKDYVINCSMGCKLKCYDVDINELRDKNERSGEFKFQYGWRVDPETHNFMIFKNFINMSFSYMTFVIKDNFDHQGHVMEDYRFDLEGYDFILNRNTLFTENSHIQNHLVKQNYDRFKFIMQNYIQIDPVLLESLHYVNDDSTFVLNEDKEGGQWQKTPKLAIHIALDAGNTRMVNIVLNYMTMIDYTALTSIKKIMSKLISYKAFANYMNGAQFQTKQMKMKQTLMVNRQRAGDDSTAIIRSAHSPCSFVDDVYFHDKMNEEIDNPLSLTYAVKIQSIRADWILNDKEGDTFLQELLKQQNREVMMTPYIQLIIEFLFQKYSESIIQRLGYPFIIHIILVVTMLASSELHRMHEAGIKPGISYELVFADTKVDDEHSEFVHSISFVCRGLIALININLTYFFVRHCYDLGTKQFKRGFFYIDLFTIIFNAIITIPIFYDIGAKYDRISEAFLVVLLMIKCIYFMKLNENIAPLINIIFSVLWDTIYFLQIFGVFELAFILAYYCIGKNQMDEAIRIGGKDSDEIPPYATFWGSFDHVFTSSIGNAKTATYYDHSMTYLIFPIFLVLAFFIKILLLKILIALMGNSFNKNYQLRESNKKMAQLEFIVENKYIQPIKHSEKKQIVYLIAAFKVDEDKNEEQVFQKINQQIKSLQTDQTKLSNNMMIEIKNMQDQQAKQMQLLYKIMKTKRPKK